MEVGAPVRAGPPFTVARDHSWCKCIFLAFGFATCVCIDILQYSMPLAVLPSVLEDQGYTMFEVAVAVGVYYWTGFAVTLIIASYQVYRVLTEKATKRPQMVPITTVKFYVIYVIVALAVGTVSLVVQAWFNTYNVHVCCRFIQGGAGGVIFNFCFLLACSIFEGEQQVFSLTACSIAFNVAEVLGSYLGAAIFEGWGMGTVFGFLAAVSVLCQGWLLLIIWSLSPKAITRSWPPSPGPSLRPSLAATPMTLGSPFRSPRDHHLHHSGSGGELPGQVTPGSAAMMSCAGFSMATHQEEEGCKRFKSLLVSPRFVFSGLLICTAAATKGAVEECLPFHADHDWDAHPLQIGEFFAIAAVTYIVASMILSKLWSWCGTGRSRLFFCTLSLVCLGFATWLVFSVRGMTEQVEVMWVALVFYGLFLGLTFMPATLLLGEAVENEDPGAAKDAVNALWNMTWEAGGSCGFLAGGFFADSYPHQVNLMTALAILCCMVASLMFAVAYNTSTQEVDEIKGKEIAIT